MISGYILYLYMSLNEIHFSDGVNGSEGSIGSAEASREQIEQYREQARKSSAQAKQDKKNEQKKKQKEHSLHKIIIQFLNDPKYSIFSLYIARTLEKNIPVEFLLSLLSLIHKDSLKALESNHSQKKTPPKQDSPFPSKLSEPLQQWTSLIFSLGSTQPHKVLETILDHNWEVDTNLIHLMSIIIREFFIWKKFDASFQDIQSFSTVFLQNLSTTLESCVHNQKNLTAQA